MTYTSASESPDAFHFWTGVATVAGALRRKVWIDQVEFEWTPNFYIILVGPPGVAAKSTSMRAGMKLLEQLEDVFFGPESLTWQALGEALEESAKIIRLGEAEDDVIQTSNITIPASELGTLLKLEDDGLASMLIDMWDGQRSLRPWKHRTRTQKEIKIHNPWLNIIGCTTPAWLRENFPEHMIGGGLTSRIIFVFGDKKRHLVPYPSEVWRGNKLEVDGREFSHKELEEALVSDLKAIGELKGAFELTREAIAWGGQWYSDLWSHTAPHLASERYKGYIARKQTHMHKIAMVVSAAKRGDMIITQEDLSEANDLLVSTEPDMIRVFESIGVVDEAKKVREIAQYLRVYGTLTSAALWQLVMNIMSFEDFSAAIQSGVEGKVFSVTSLREPGGEKVKALRLANATLPPSSTNTPP